jgi:hypothetical protein
MHRRQAAGPNATPIHFFRLAPGSRLAEATIGNTLRPCDWSGDVTEDIAREPPRALLRARQCAGALQDFLEHLGR